MPAARMIAFAMALLGCVLIMYKAIWYDQLACPDGFLLRVRGPVAPGLGGGPRGSARQEPQAVSCGSRGGCPR